MQSPFGSSGGVFAGRYRVVRELAASPDGHTVLVEDTLRGGRSRVLKSVAAARARTLLADLERLPFFGHPNLGLPHGLLQLDTGVGVVVQPYYPGGDLAEWRATEPPLAAVLQACTELLRGLACLHDHGLVHRDVKPSNAVFDGAGAVRLIDFGLARAANAEFAELSGTPAFLAPELFRGGEPSVASDLYAFGVSLVWLLTGGYPFVEDPLARLRDMATSADRPPQLSGLERLRAASHTRARLQGLCESLLSADPSNRPRTAGDVIDALASCGSEVAALPRETVDTALSRLKVSGFFGRPALESEFRQVIFDTVLGNEGAMPVWWVTSERGGGRTALLEAVRRMALLRGVECPEIAAPDSAAELAIWLGRGGLPRSELTAQGLATALLREAELRPFCLVVDDVERASPELVELIRLLARLYELRSRARLLLVLGLPDGLAGRADLQALADEVPLFCPVRTVRLARLDEAATRALAQLLSPGAPCPPSLAAELHRMSVGNPGLLSHLLEQLVRGGQVPLFGARALPLELPVQLVAAGDLMEGARQLTAAASADGLEAATALALADVSIPVPLALALVEACGMAEPRAALASAQRAGLLAELETAKGPQVGPAGMAVAAVLVERAPPELPAKVAAALASMGAPFEAACARLLARQGRLAEATQWAIRAERWRDVVEWGAALRATMGPELPLELAEGLAVALAVTGSPAEARRLVAEMRGRADLDLARAAHVDVRLAEIELEAGRPREVVELLSPRVELFPADARRWALALLARSRLLLGETDAAMNLAESLLGASGAEAGQGAADDPAAFHAQATRALARMYRGAYDAALAELTALAVAASAGGPRKRDEPFLRNAVGIVHQRMGQLPLAVEAYQQSLSAAVEQRNPAREGIALMNLGTIAQESGELSQAFGHYREAEAVARRTGDDTALVKALLNQSNLALQAGDVETARKKVELGQRLSPRAQNPFLGSYLLLLSGEVQFRSDRLDAAQALAASAREGFSALGSVREAAEATLLEARILSAARRFDRLEPALEALRDAGRTLKALRFTLWASYLEVVAEYARPSGDAPAALRRLRVVRDQADEVLRPEDLWRPHWLLAWGAASQGAWEDAGAFALRAQKLLLRISDKLDDSMRTHFLAVPEHSYTLAGCDILLRATSALGPGAGFVERVLELNKRLATETNPQHLLATILDVAIATTGGERGFVLVPPQSGDFDELDVQIARNYDRESLRKRELKFSTSIARDVFATGEPLLSIDAQEDDRLQGQRSVFAMKLRSVLCVPMRHQGAPIGVIYIDNRFQRGAFTREHLQFMEAFADQAGLALAWAQSLERERTARVNLESANGELRQSRERIEVLNRELEAQLAERTAKLEATQQQLAQQQTLLGGDGKYAGIVGSSAMMRRVFSLIERVKDTAVPVLVTGESGTGKELVANALHHEGRRAAQRFVSINCAAMPENLLESELFGSVRGAFTGADRDRAGLFEEADKGTLFLDEVGDMSLTMQVKLLRVLESGEVRRVGSSQTRTVQVRIVAATNKDLAAMAKRGEFREDLYFRLNVVEIRLPPLRERHEDLPLLCDHFLSIISERHQVPRKRLSPAAIKAIRAYPWPGNIRELSAALTAAVLLSDGDALQPEDLPFSQGGEGGGPGGRGASAERAGWDGVSTLEEMESLLIRDAFERLGRNKSQTAKALAIDRNTLYAKLKRLGIE
jgi:DNA-binding NtrC family response regulator/tetratricopeptide (TPR) repeat protein